MSMINYMLSRVEHGKSLKTSGQDQISLIMFLTSIFAILSLEEQFDWRQFVYTLNSFIIHLDGLVQAPRL